MKLFHDKSLFEGLESVVKKYYIKKTLYGFTQTNARSKRYTVFNSDEMKKTSKNIKKEMPTAPGVPRRSPIQVLTGPDVA